MRTCGLWACVLILISGIGHAPAAASSTRSGPRVACASCIIVGPQQHLLWARDAGERRPNASTTKLVTALVVVEQVNLHETVTISAAAARTSGGGVDLRAGDRFSVLQLLEAMLIESANDSAVALAEHVAGSEGSFVRQMNRLARRLGATDSHFENAHGLDAPGHGTSARDLARFGLAVLERPELAAIVATRRTTIQGLRRDITLVNTNLLLKRYKGLLGIKTGYTLGAGNVLVAAVRHEGGFLITVAMGSENAFKDTRRLLDYARATLAVGEVVWRELSSLASEVLHFGRAAFLIVLPGPS